MSPAEKRLPHFVKNPHRSRRALHKLKKRLRRAGLHTVCESARCPNIIECFQRPQAAFMILGNRCTRGCGFCAVEQAEPLPPDPGEPKALARAVRELGLRHVVVTSPARDDLEDGGASQFAAVIHAVRQSIESASVEVLVPDFQGARSSIETVLDKNPDVFNHNLEVAPRLYPLARPGAKYLRSLRVLSAAAGLAAGRTLIKSGLMVGLGERKSEVISVFQDLADAGVSAVTVGQYLQPSKHLLPVERYWQPEEYEELAREGEGLGLSVFAGPLVRSSYMADQVLQGMNTCPG